MLRQDPGAKLMLPAGTRLDATVRISVGEPLRAVNAQLTRLLRGFSDEDWEKPTVHKHRNVKDLTAHLLHGSNRRMCIIGDPTDAEPLLRFVAIMA
jgi:hypothetical protein